MSAEQSPASGHTRRVRDRSARPEHRWPVLIGIAAAIVLNALMPARVQFLPVWILPTIFSLLVIPLVIANPRRLSLETTWSRWLSIGLSVALAAANQVTIILTIRELLGGRTPGAEVLLAALQVWVTNVIAFGLVYWELDRGGPVARRVDGLRDDAVRGFRFPQ